VGSKPNGVHDAVVVLRRREAQLNFLRLEKKHDRPRRPARQAHTGHRINSATSGRRGREYRRARLVEIVAPTSTTHARADRTQLSIETSSQAGTSLLPSHSFGEVRLCSRPGELQIQRVACPRNHNSLTISTIFTLLPPLGLFLSRFCQSQTSEQIRFFPSSCYS